MRQIEKSSKFKSGKYGSKSAETQNSVQLLGGPGDVDWRKSTRIHPLNLGYHMLSLKLLVILSVDTLTGENQPYVA